MGCSLSFNFPSLKECEPKPTFAKNFYLRVVKGGFVEVNDELFYIDSISDNLIELSRLENKQKLTIAGDFVKEIVDTLKEKGVC